MNIKNFCTVFAALVALNGIVATPAMAQLPLAQPALTLDLGGGASVLARQLDGKVIAAGTFTKVNGSARANLARFNADGSLDIAFNPTVNGAVSAVVVAGSAIYITGSFTRVSGVPRARLAKLNITDGSLDPTFNAAPDNVITGMSADADGSLYVTGSFTTVGGISGRALVKLSGTSGLADSAWNPAFPAALTGIAAIAANGAYLYVVGYLATDVNAQIGRAHRVVRATGAYDPTWVPPSARLTNEGFGVAMAFDTSGNVIVAGSGGYTNNIYGGNQLALMTIEKFLVSTGAADTAWTAPGEGTFLIAIDGTDLYTSVQSAGLLGSGGTNAIVKRSVISGVASGGWSIPDSAQGYVLAILASPEGIWAAGYLSFVNASRSVGIVRLDASTGAHQAGFPASVTVPGQGMAIAALPDGKFLLGGKFDSVNGLPRSNLARLNADGTLDASWTTETNSEVWRLAVRGSDVYAVGFFTSVGGISRTGVARFNATSGVADSGWNANIDGAVRRIAFDATDVYLMGSFSTVGGLPRSTLAKVSGVDGTVISAFNPQFEPGCNPGTSGLAYAAGFAYADIRPFCKLPYDGNRRLGRFSSVTGAYDATWTPAPNGTVRDMVISGDNLYAIGSFSSVGGTAKPRFAKIGLTSGALDTTWGNAPSAQSIMYSVSIAGNFIYVGGANYDAVTGLAKPIMGRHLLTTGFRDTGWNPLLTPIVPNDTSLGNSSIASSLTGDRVLIAANFAAVANQPRDGFAAFAVNQAPLSAPTNVVGTPGNAQLFVSFSVPASDGGSTISGYTVTCTPTVGAATIVTGLASPVTVAGLSNGVAYTCTVYGTNGIGVGPESTASTSVTPSPASPPALIVTTAGSGFGTVTSAAVGIACPGDCLETYATGTAVTLTAVASSGSTFTGWLGACSGTAVCNVTINGVTNVGATFAPSVILPLRIDVDNTTDYSALTDGMVIFRYLTGATGSSLANGAATVDTTQLFTRFNDMRPVFDIDRNGQVEAATDGMLLLRYLFGLRGSALTAGVIGGNATRTSPGDIEAYIQSLTP